MAIDTEVSAAGVVFAAFAIRAASSCELFVRLTLLPAGLFGAGAVPPAVHRALESESDDGHDRIRPGVIVMSTPIAPIRTPISTPPISTATVVAEALGSSSTWASIAVAPTTRNISMNVRLRLDVNARDGGQTAE